MSLEKLSKEIISEAQKKALAITEEGNTEAEAIMDKAKKDSQANDRKSGEQTKKILEEISQVELSGLNLLLNKKRMEAKKIVLDEVFEQAKKEIEDMDKAKKAELAKKLCARAQSELPNAKFVYSNESDKKTVSAVKGLTFKDTIDCIGGVIIENSDGSIKINYTFEEILEKVKEENLHEVANRVFAKTQ